MERDNTSFVRSREIRFCRLHPDKTQAQSASLMLGDVEGVSHVQPVESHLLHIRYDISVITLNIIEETLSELGYHLDNSLMNKLKRALYYYTEETQRANLGLEKSCCADKQMFINRYLKRSHGCRDERPEHWRNYL
ncbi:MAG: hypothetical protein OQK54_00110 [Gammaproteobacteria bacterium]|nr:hypothetical protein [Gammaproteobacteria bacterium]